MLYMDSCRMESGNIVRLRFFHIYVRSVYIIALAPSTEQIPAVKLYTLG